MLHFWRGDCRAMGALFKIGAKFSVYPNLWRNDLNLWPYFLKSENYRTYSFPTEAEKFIYNFITL
jgi:hypothetical protein